MLGDGSRAHAEQDQSAGTGFGRGDFQHYPARTVGQHLAGPGLPCRALLAFNRSTGAIDPFGTGYQAPITTIGRDREWLGADDLAPDTTGQPEAVAADAA